MLNVRLIAKLVRSVVISSTLLLSAAVAHAMGCGTFVSGRRLLLESCFLVVLFTIFARGKLDGPRLATLVVFSQLSVHYLLGGMMMNNQRMLFFHFLSGIACFWIISRIENFRNYISRAISHLLGTEFLPLEQGESDRSQPIHFREERFFSDRSRRLGVLRAPPLLVS